jgi:hypothetical protein
VCVLYIYVYTYDTYDTYMYTHKHTHTHTHTHSDMSKTINDMASTGNNPYTNIRPNLPIVRPWYGCC